VLETTHVLTALALAKNINPPVGGPILAFFAGMVSHFILDSLPHYDFQGRIFKNSSDGDNRKKELSKTGKLVIGSDIFVSFLVFLYLSVWGPLWPNFPDLNSLFLILYSNLNWVFGVLGGIFPDIMSFVGFKTGFAWPKWFFNLHKNIQKNKEIKPLPGLAFQLTFCVFCIYIFVK